MKEPQVILLLSGKRKSGKDFLAEKLHKIFGDDVSTIVRISEPIKSHYAEAHELNLQELMSDGPYKEKYRKSMIEWSDSVRLKEPGFFCKAACAKASVKTVWIVSDIRRLTDIKWFEETYGDKIKTIRIFTNDDIRRDRGWVFTAGVDDVPSECDLDEYLLWHLIVTNISNEQLEAAIKIILEFVYHPK